MRSSVDIYLDDGAGQFIYDSQPQFFASVSQLELVDLDGDGDQDLAAMQSSGNQVYVFENLGGGDFGPRQDFVSGTPQVERLALVDVDRDGRKDVTAFRRGSFPPVWFRNEPGTSLGPAALIPQVEVFPTRGLETADLNADGILDFVVVTDAPAVRMLVSDASLGAVPYGPLAEVAWAQVPGMRDVAAIDLDGDGDLDIVGAGETGELYVAVARGFTDRSFPVPLGVETGTFLHACDLDGDGDEDLVLR